MKEDREKLKAMQKSQPRFTEGQRQELQDVHPWLRAGGLPTALDLTVSSAASSGAVEVDGAGMAPRRGGPAALLYNSNF